jgi:transposase
VVDHVKRQVVELIIKSHVKEYRLEVVEDETGKRYTAMTPEGASRPIQYGNSIKATSVYMNLYQMIPYARLQDFFLHQGDIPISEGSVFNFNKEAASRLDAFEVIAKSHLGQASLLHVDETGINVSGKRIWLHNASNNKWVWLEPHETRGTSAMDEIGVLPNFRGVMVHDGWSSYFTYKDASHALCNAHHLRELQAAIEVHPTHTWAKDMKDLLLSVNDATIRAGGVLKEPEAQKYRRDYREIIAKGELECPELLALPLGPTSLGNKKKRGNKKVAQTKERNLLQRLKLYELETLRFMTDIEVPFTNNRGENDIRMTKVQQKISGCFKTIENAKIFCRIRSYLLTAQKHGIHATDALTTLFGGKLPDFCTVS